VIKSESGDLLYDDVEKVECFKSLFSSVFINDNGIIPSVISKAKRNSSSDTDFTYDDVFNAIANLKPKTSVGPDGLSAVFI